MSNADGMTVGSIGIGRKPIGYEDTMDTDDGAGIYSYSLNQDGTYTLNDYLGFIGDALTLDSEILSDYRTNIDIINGLIILKEEEILAITGTWGVFERIQKRLELDELNNEKSAFEKAMNILLDKYK
jgi:hypothetical protein